MLDIDIEEAKINVDLSVWEANHCRVSVIKVDGEPDNGEKKESSQRETPNL